jgi:hypothetical protein
LRRSQPSNQLDLSQLFVKAQDGVAPDTIQAATGSCPESVEGIRRTALSRGRTLPSGGAVRNPPPAAYFTTS